MPVHPETIMRLMLRERVKLVAYIAAIVHDRHLAEDLYQDLSIEALRKAETINDETHLMGWLRTAGRFRAIDYLRKQAARPVAFSSVLIDQLDEAWSEIDDQPMSETINALRDCLDTLAPKARQTLTLRYAEGLSGEEIGQRLGKTSNTVYVALTRIHKALAVCINRQLGRRHAMEGPR